jgi:hypothetical protein
MPTVKARLCLCVCFFFGGGGGRDSSQWAMASPFTRFLLSHTMTHHSRLDSSGRVTSSSKRPLCDKAQSLQQTDIHAPVGFERTISVGERPQTYALDRAATGTGKARLWVPQNSQRHNEMCDYLLYRISPKSVRAYRKYR